MKGHCVRCYAMGRARGYTHTAGNTKLSITNLPEITVVSDEGDPFRDPRTTLLRIIGRSISLRPLYPRVISKLFPGSIYRSIVLYYTVLVFYELLVFTIIYSVAIFCA